MEKKWRRREKKHQIIIGKLYEEDKNHSIVQKKTRGATHPLNSGQIHDAGTNSNERRMLRKEKILKEERRELSRYSLVLSTRDIHKHRVDDWKKEKKKKSSIIQSW